MLCSSLPLLVFLGSPSSRSLISSQNHPVQSHDPPAFTNQPSFGKEMIVHQTLSTRIKRSCLDESGVNLVF